MRAYTLILPAGVPKSVHVRGEYVHVYSSTSDDLIVRFDSGEPCPMRQGFGVRRKFDTVEFMSPSGQTITVYLGFGDVKDTRDNFATGAISGASFAAGADVVCPTGVATLVQAGNGKRSAVILCNIGANSGAVRVGPAGVGAASGIYLGVGGTLAIETTSAIWVYNPNGASVTISSAWVQEA